MLNAISLVPGLRLSRPGPPLTQHAFNEFGALLGTDAPIHVDPEYAEKTPFGGTIAQGMLLLAPFDSWLCEVFGEQAWSRSGRLKAKLLQPAKVGDVILLEMEVREVSLSRVLLEIRVLCGDRLLATGEAEISRNA